MLRPAAKTGPRPMNNEIARTIRPAQDCEVANVISAVDSVDVAVKLVAERIGDRIMDNEPVRARRERREADRATRARIADAERVH